MRVKLYADLSQIVNKGKSKGEAFIEVPVPDNMRVKPSKGSAVTVWDDDYDVSYLGEVLDVKISAEGQPVAVIMLDLATSGTVDSSQPVKRKKNNIAGIFGVFVGLLANGLFWFNPLGYISTIFSSVANNVTGESIFFVNFLLDNAAEPTIPYVADITNLLILLVFPLLGAALMRRHWSNNGSTSLGYHFGGVLNTLAAGIAGFGFYVASITYLVIKGMNVVNSLGSSPATGDASSTSDSSHLLPVLTVGLGLFIIIPAFLNFVIMYKVNKK